MIKTILFGKINSRKKFNKKIVISAFVDDGILDMTIAFYEKKVKRWEFVTNNVNDIQCDEQSFMDIKEFYLKFNNKLCNKSELDVLMK